MKISIVINADTRPGVDSQVSEFRSMNEGCRHYDFLLENVRNKKRFFEGFEFEIILHVDVHQPLPDDLRRALDSEVDCLILRRHDRYYHGIENFSMFNDVSYLNALSVARGDIIAHFDADCAAFAKDSSCIQDLINLLESYKYVSYPSPWSPNPVHDDSFDHWWVSTRFFMCKHDTLDFTEIKKCLQNSDYMWDKYGHKKRKCPWLEHILGVISDSRVLYPPMHLSRLAIFCWDRYYTGVLSHLAKLSFPEIVNYIESCGGIHYPNDVTAIPI